MEIICTGTSGFVGQNLLQYLKNRDYNCVNISLRKKDWHLHMPGSATAIIHLAGKAHDTSNTSISDEYFGVNRDLTIELFKKFLNSDIHDFFYFSSVKAVADTVAGVLVEDVQPKPLTPYGKSKLEAEQFLLSQTLPQGKRLFIIRPCMIHGPGNKGNLNLLYKVVDKNIPWPLSAFHNQRSFLSIDNLSYIIYKMLTDQSVPSGVYNVADDESLSTNDLVSLIAATLGKKEHLWHISPGFIKSMVRIGDILPLPLNSERLKKLTESYVVSNQKIKTALGVDKLPLSAKEGLIKTILSFKVSK
ncbi:NAD-dependent epimerase/dehydratase family protein [Sphingobacterium sp. UBA2074]|uniref:NAD-dependent epimerase/dehydratase family protein n=1 Tax=Sphingobacterium sp. UBA2074 TaxID=1947487 RepID=UPI00257BAB15|nr:NAD-dependent epimerase/dehydratase family protein [Sphingobacterium sp. UBA2074]